MDRILAINPGATSTKIAVFDEETLLFQKTVEHHGTELQNFKRVIDQYGYRLKLILTALDEANVPLKTITAVVGRGGLLKPLASGTYLVNDAMLDDLREARRGEHASNLGGVLAYEISKKNGIQAYIVDPVSVDELNPEARISGWPELPRISFSHALNSKGVAKKVAVDLKKNYDELRLIVVHLGTGISVSAHLNGHMIDVNNAQDEGPFSPDRSGGLPTRQMVKLCFSGKYTEKELLSNIFGSGGMYAYLGTKDIREAEKRAKDGDQQADLILKAMVYQIAKEIGAMSTVLAGEVDSILLTGGIAYSSRITEEISKKVKFIAPILVIPGEEELVSLAAGVNRVLRGEEHVKDY